MGDKHHVIDQLHAISHTLAFETVGFVWEFCMRFLW